MSHSPSIVRAASAALTLASLALASCSATSPTQRETVASAAPAPVLGRSLFARDANGTVAEDDLQKILDAKLDLEFPARIGVVALARAFEAGESERPGLAGSIARGVTSALEGAPEFAVVTDVSTALPRPTGIEGLRTIAARYRLRYLVVCSTVYEGRSHLNNWAWLYPTGVGLLLAPGVTVASEGFVQASLFDVKTGTVLTTATEPFTTSSVSWLIGSEREHESRDADAIAKASSAAASALASSTSALVAWSKTTGASVAAQD